VAWPRSTMSQAGRPASLHALTAGLAQRRKDAERGVEGSVSRGDPILRLGLEGRGGATDAEARRMRVFVTMKRLRLERRMPVSSGRRGRASPFRAGWEGGWCNIDAIVTFPHPSASRRLRARQTDDNGAPPDRRLSLFPRGHSGAHPNRSAPPVAPESFTHRVQRRSALSKAGRPLCRPRWPVSRSDAEAIAMARERRWRPAGGIHHRASGVRSRGMAFRLSLAVSAVSSFVPV